MKTTLQRFKAHRGFTLVEVIGVLSIIAVLASVLVPGIMDTISRSRVMDAVGSYNSIKAGAITYASKYGYLGDENGNPLDVSTSPPQAAAWDQQVLVPLRFVDEGFRSRISTSVSVQLRQTVDASTLPDADNAAYNLDGATIILNKATGTKHVLDVLLTDVALEDVRVLNRAIDGENTTLGETEDGKDLRGRVKYDFTTGGSPTSGNVRLYITHL